MKSEKKSLELIRHSSFPVLFTFSWGSEFPSCVISPCSEGLPLAFPVTQIYWRRILSGFIYLKMSLFCLYSWRIFLLDIEFWAEYFPFSTLKMFHFLPVPMVYNKKSAVNQIAAPLPLTGQVALAALRKCTLPVVSSSLVIYTLRWGFFVFVLLGICVAFCNVLAFVHFCPSLNLGHLGCYFSVIFFCPVPSSYVLVKRILGSLRSSNIPTALLGFFPKFFSLCSSPWILLFSIFRFAWSFLSRPCSC